MRRNKSFLLLIPLLLITIFFIYILKEQDTQTSGNNVKGDETRVCKQYKEEIEREIQKSFNTRAWYVKSSLVPQENIELQIELPKEDISIRYVLDNVIAELIYDGAYWKADIPVNTMEYGEHTLDLVVNNCGNEYPYTKIFNVSAPVYVAWSIDWEGFDVKQQYLDQMAQLSRQYQIPMTHMFNPYIYVSLTNERSQYLTSWVKARNEPIGLHLHMYTKLVESAGVKADNSIAWGSPTGNGHDTPNSAYGYNDYKKIIQWSINQFERNNLGRPTIFRAGGWFIDEENIQVLNDLEFNIDTSGRTYYIHGRNQLKGEWNLKSTTQPYQMNSIDQNITNNPNINIWQYPNNGGDSWAYTSQKLIQRFNENYKGGITTTPTVVTFISHPHWFDKEGPNISGVIEHMNNLLYSEDSGPVIFTTLDKIHQNNVKL